MKQNKKKTFVLKKMREMVILGSRRIANNAALLV